MKSCLQNRCATRRDRPQASPDSSLTDLFLSELNEPFPGPFTVGSKSPEGAVLQDSDGIGWGSGHGVVEAVSANQAGPHHAENYCRASAGMSIPLGKCPWLRFPTKEFAEKDPA